MTKFSVTFESTAAVCVEIVVEAKNEDDAKKIADASFDKGDLRFTDLVDGLMSVDESAIAGWNSCKGSALPVRSAFVALDEMGFGSIDVFEIKKPEKKTA